MIDNQAARSLYASVDAGPQEAAEQFAAVATALTRFRCALTAYFAYI
jgi:hypothetical protein